MRLSSIIIPASAALFLSGCGSETSSTFTTDDGESGEYTVDAETGESSMTVETADGEVNVRSGSSVPVDLPAGFSLIAGAEVVSNTVFDQAGTKGALLNFRSSKDPQEIADFYRAEAEAAGVDIQIETSMNDGKMLGGENEASGLTFSITAYPDGEGMTIGQLTVGEDPG